LTFHHYLDSDPVFKTLKFKKSRNGTSTLWCVFNIYASFVYLGVTLALSYFEKIFSFLSFKGTLIFIGSTSSSRKVTCTVLKVCEGLFLRWNVLCRLSLLNNLHNMASQVILSTHPQLYLMLESSALRYPVSRPPLRITICFSLPMIVLLPNLSLRIWGGGEGGKLLTLHALLFASLFE
jgi:hypothetical protein